MLNYKEIQALLMKELRLYHYPIAVNFFFDQKKLDEYVKKMDFKRPVKPLTYCQLEVMARMKGDSVLAFKDDMACSNSQVSFGWRPIDEKEIKTQQKYTVDLEQAERFLRSKPSLNEGLLALSVGPLEDAVIKPDVVHFYCDNIQSYHLAVDYMAATNTHPLRPMITMSSSACGGSVYSFNQQTFNTCPACSGSYNAGKTERGEVNVFIPGNHFEAVINRLKDRISDKGTASITRPGDPFPGADICKNCPLIILKKGDKDVCQNCEKV